MRNQANNIVGAAVTIGIAVIVMVLLMLVAGNFIDEVPTDADGNPTGAFGTEIFAVRDTGGSAFNLLAVALLVVPAGAIVTYLFRSGLGNFVSQGR